ncbi:DUF11 domain-containing protein [Methanococcoides sp. SA1]|nr:DUF11 domain-containing protein [Methanococcoides sp. SA1]
MKLRFMALLVALIVVMGAGAASAKSLYVIEDINAPGNIPIAAYDIQPTQMVKQTVDTIPDRNGGAVGITIDSDSGFLFVTFEVSGVLDIVDGTTMTRVGQVTAPGASNLAGIVVDQDQQMVYAVDRHTSNLYVYDWDATAKTLTLVPGAPFTLTHSRAVGIALDEINDVLYVASSDATIDYYETATWTHQGSITLSSSAIGVAVDAQRGLLYAGGWDDTVLSKYDLNTATETTKTLGGSAKPIGFAVDSATGNLFVTTYGEDHLRMMDSNLNVLDETGDLGNPTGVCVPGKEVSFNPLNMDKTDGVTKVYPSGDLTYTISYDNALNNNPVNSVMIVDSLPAEVTFVSASDSGVYNSTTHTVTWTIGTLAAGAASDSVSVTVNVGASTPIGTMLDNAATISSKDTAQTTQHDSDTEVVKQQQEEIPEFPTVALPVLAIIGLAFFFQRRNNE